MGITTRGGYKGNKNAEKPPSERLSVNVNFRARPEDREAWKEKANKSGKSLSAWITDTLNKS